MEGKLQLYLLRKCTNYIIFLAQTLYKKVSLKCKKWVYLICSG